MDIKQTLKDLENLKKDFEKKAQATVKDVFKEIFVQVPELSLITWVQYAPGFNDGDPCVFSVHSPAFVGGTKADIKAFEESDDFDDCGGWSNFEDMDTETLEKYNLVNLDPYGDDKGPLSATKRKLLKDLSRAMQNELEDALEQAFGDGAKVTVTAKGITVDEYDCGY